MNNDDTLIRRRRMLLTYMLGGLASPLLLDACGGGSGGSGSAAVPVATPAPAPTPSPPVTLIEPGMAVSIVVNQTALGPTLDSTFAGFSYEKSRIYFPLFNADNTALISLFKRLGPGILRMGGASVDETMWNPTGGGLTLNQVAPADIDRLSGFLKAVNWKIIYGMNFATNTQALMAAEAAYAAASLGDNLLGFELGNEPDIYFYTGLRPSTYTYADFQAEWTGYANAISAQTPKALFIGPGTAANTGTYVVPFAAAESKRIALLTQHYYIDAVDGGAADFNSTTQLNMLLQADPQLPVTLQTLNATAKANGIAGGYRIDEANSFYEGPAIPVTDSLASALWAIDFLFINALNGSSGVNFHGGGNAVGGITPIAENGTTVIQVRPEYYAMLLFSQAAQGNLLATTINSGGLLLTAYAVAGSDGTQYVVVVNKDSTNNAHVALQFNTSVSNATILQLTGQSLTSPNDIQLNAAAINADGSWSPTSLASMAVSRGNLTLNVAPACAVLITAS